MFYVLYHSTVLTDKDTKVEWNSKKKRSFFLNSRDAVSSFRKEKRYERGRIARKNEVFLNIP